MKRILLLVLLALPLTAMAQKKQFTLDDLIPGGKTYRSLQPENKFYTWWGEKCIELDTEHCSLIDLQNGNATDLITLESVNTALSVSNLRRIPHFYNAQFPYSNKYCIMTKVANQRALIDFVNNKVVWSVTLDQNAANEDFNPASLATAYTKGGNLFVQTADGSVNQISNDGSADIVYGESVHRNEFGINKGTFWSPDGQQLAFYRMDQSMVSKYPQVNITPYDDSQMFAGRDSADLSSRCALLEPDAYPMAGETSHKVTIGVYNITSKKITYLKTADPTDRYFTNIAWSPDNRSIYVIELNREQNHAELIEYDAESGEKVKTLFTEDNEKYVEPSEPIRFLPWDDTKFIYLTRKDGYNHIYLYNTKGKQLKQLTSGNFEVMDILGFNVDIQAIVYTSNEKSPIQKNVFGVDMKGKRFMIGNSSGWHNASLSKSGTMVLDNYSSPTFPRHIDLVSVNTVNMINLLSAQDKWNEYNVPQMKVGTIKSADGTTDLYYRLVLPTDFDPTKKYPAIVYVYGGPHAHNVDASIHNGVRGWDIYMAQKGYVMFCLDNRGSEHRGLAFEQATFRKLGYEEMRDQLMGVAFLKSLPYVDADRLGIHGWSFGGFMTTSLMTSFANERTDNPTIFKGECPFKCGVAGGPVIDWRFYEVMYGERYMDTPQTNPEGYRNTSLLNKAQNLKGRLMVIYGGNDNTCVPQHTLSFMRACIDAGTYPDLFTYPGDGHNMSGRDRIHLHEVITRYFEDHLKPLNR